MKAFASFEEYKTAIANTPSQRVREELLAEADACGFSAWQMAELCAVRDDPWA